MSPTSCAKRSCAEPCVLRLASSRWCVLLISLWAATQAAQAERITRYVHLNDQIGQAGEQVVVEADDGLVSVNYRYKNNGRGPELTERYRLAPDGSFSEYQVQGTSTFGAKVDERFKRDGDLASWTSSSEKGQAKVSGAAMYVPLNSSYVPLSVAITALARRADGEMALLPSGLLKHRKLTEIEVSKNTPTGPIKQRVQLLVQTGLDLQPLFMWATTGATPRLFAYDGFWGEVFIEEGWQDNRAALAAQQMAAEHNVLRDMATRLRHPLPGLTVVRNARVFDPVLAQLSAPADVYVLRGRITAVLPAGSRAQKADNDIDASGRVMLPGLFDMHGHTDRWQGALHLASGVTTLRDMGNNNPSLQTLLDSTAAGTVLGPQIVPCGFLEGKSAFSSSLGFTISSLAEAQDAIDWYVQRGYPQLKIYNSFPKEILRETVAYAHLRGMRVSGHVPAFMRAAEVVAMGFDEIQHINQVLLNFLVTPQTDTRTLQRFILPAEKLDGLDLDSGPVQDFVDLLQRHETVIDPTLATFDFIKQRDGEMSAPYAAVAAHLPPSVQRYLVVAGMDIADDSTAARYGRSYNKMIDFVGRLHRAGVPLVAGSDAIAGLTIPAELALYVQAGLSPAQALRVATLNGATYSGTLADRGSVSVGKLADLLLVDGDPTQDIQDLYKVALVLTQGHWLAPSELHRELGIKPFVDVTPVVRRLTPLGVAVGAGGAAGGAAAHGAHRHAAHE